MGAWTTFFRYPTPWSSRLRTIFYFSWFTFTGLIFASRGNFPLIIALKTIGAIVGATIFVYALGDAMDAELDKLSPRKAKRPIPSGLMTERQAILLSSIGGLVGISLCLTLNFWTTVFSLIFMGLGFSYSVPPIRLKRRFLMKETTLTTGGIISMLIGCAAVEGLQGSIFLPGFFLAIVGLTLYPTFYDARDIQEDKVEGCKTIAMILNQRRRLELSTFGLLIFMITTTLTYGYFNLNIICPILTVFASLVFLRYIFPLLLKSDRVIESEVMEKVTSIGRVFTFIVPIGFILSSLRL
ncbi:UbiA prenyltransferase family protein [Candidatus Bathyarchaeota archaeon]|nr:UbiA prenyltransferase family protein [Candidatus Bathyarchaeota archaeon]